MFTKAENLKPGDKLTVGCYNVPITGITDLGPNSVLICVFFCDSPVGTSVFLNKNLKVGYIPSLPDKDGSLIHRVEITDNRVYGDSVVFVRRGDWFFHSPNEIIPADEIVSFRHYED